MTLLSFNNSIKVEGAATIGSDGLNIYEINNKKDKKQKSKGAPLFNVKDFKKRQPCCEVQYIYLKQ